MKVNTITTELANQVLEILLKSILENSDSPPVNLLLCGPHGVGKTTIVKELAERFNIELTITRPSGKEHTSLYGFEVENNGKTTTLLPGWLPDEKSDKPRILFIDELNRCSPMLLNSVLSLLDRNIDNIYSLPSNVLIIAAINPDDGNYFTVDLDPSFKDRFLTLPIKSNIEGHVNYMKKHLYDKHIVDFVDEEMINVNEKEYPGEELDISRRSFDVLNRVYSLMSESEKENQQLLQAITGGCIGNRLAKQFVSRHRMADGKANDILNKILSGQIKSRNDFEADTLFKINNLFIRRISLSEINDREIKRYLNFIFNFYQDLITALLVNLENNLTARGKAKEYMNIIAIIVDTPKLAKPFKEIQKHLKENLQMELGKILS